LVIHKYVVSRHAELVCDIKEIPSRNEAKPWSICALELCLNGSSTMRRGFKGPTTVSRGKVYN
jgi:hypothetical protein